MDGGFNFFEIIVLNVWEFFQVMDINQNQLEDSKDDDIVDISSSLVLGVIVGIVIGFVVVVVVVFVVGIIFYC